MTKITSLRLSQDHDGSDDASTIAQQLNMRGTSPLLSMAGSPDHRDTVTRYRDAAVWQQIHCHERGDAHESELWFKVVKNLTMVLAATRSMYLHQLAHAQKLAAREGSTP